MEFIATKQIMDDNMGYREFVSDMHCEWHSFHFAVMVVICMHMHTLV